jgi:hypothetical protein
MGMVAQTATAHQPFSDVDEGFVTRRDDVFVDLVDLVDPAEEIVDPLSPMRGLVFGLLLCAPFWMGVYWVLQ